MNIIKRFFIFILTPIFIVFLCSCFKKNSDKENEIKFVWFGSEEETKVIRQIVDDFSKQYPEIKVTIQMVEWLRFNEKMLTMMLGGRAPDISRMSAQWCNRYAELEAFADIEDLLKPEKIEDFVDSRLASCRYKDMLFGLPQSSIGLMLYYNADLLEKAGIAVPESSENSWSWDEFEFACKTIKEKTGVKYGWSTFKGWFPLTPFFYQNGGRFFNDDLSKTMYNSKENIEALNWFVAQHKTGIAPISAWTGGDSGVDLFARGNCAFLIMGNWSLTTFSNRIKDFKWGVTYLPHNKVRASNVGGENLVIFNTKKKDKALKLLMFITNKENIAKFSKEALFIPTRKSLLTGDFIYNNHNEYMHKFMEQSKDFQPEWAAEQSTTAFSELENDFLKNIELALLEQKTAEEALTSVDTAYDNLKK